MNEYGESVINALERTIRHMNEGLPVNILTVKKSLQNSARKDPKTEQESEEIVEKLVQGQFLIPAQSEYDEKTEVEEIKLDEFKQWLGYCEPFTLPEDIEKPQNREIAHYFTPWLIENHDVRSVLLDVERDNYETWSYDEVSKTWNNDGVQKLRQIASDELNELYSKSVKSEIVERLKTQKVLDYEETGADEGEIAVNNGILDLHDNQMRDIEKDDYITSKIPVNFEGGVGAPDIWTEYLEEVVPSESGRKTLQEYAGYCLMPWTAKYERGLMLLGPTDSGKSVFLDVMRKLLGGDKNVADESLQDLANTRWAVASLKGKIANIDHDLDPKSIKKVGKVQKLTSGNEMMAERKMEKKFKLKPTAKLMFSANRVPDSTKETDAYYNRWLTVTFPESIPTSQQDKDLVDKLTKDENLEGILRWAIEGQQRLKEQQEFTGDMDPLATKELWKEWGNSVDRFISQYCIRESEVSKEEREDMTFKVHFSTLYDLYQEFAVVNGFEKESQKGFSEKAKENPSIRKGRPSINGNQDRGFFGVKIKEDAFKTLKNKQEGSGQE